MRAEHLVWAVVVIPIILLLAAMMLDDMAHGRKL